MIRIVAVDDHPIILDALENAINKQEDMQLVATTDHGSRLLDLVKEHQPDIAIMDLGMSTGRFDPVAAVRNLKEQYPKVKVLVVTAYKSVAWARVLVEAGISGYLLKSDTSQSIAEAIRHLYKGKRYFSPQISGELIGYNKEIRLVQLVQREVQILTLLDEGKSTEVVAASLGVSTQRIRNMLVKICNKLEVERDGVSPRIAAIHKAHTLGLLPNSEYDPNLVGM